jgi:lambda repressor-like predicted transcriptional regulator
LYPNCPQFAGHVSAHRAGDDVPDARRPKTRKPLNFRRSSGVLVGVLRSYCNHNLATRQLDELLVLAGSSSPTVRSSTRVISGRARRLTHDQIDELCSLYQKGQSLPRLAIFYGIHRGTVKDHLRRAGIEIRPGNVAKLSAEDKDQIARLYEAGISIHKLALQFGVTDNPVHTALKKRGVRMRDPHGRVLQQVRSGSSPSPSDQCLGSPG